MWDTRPRDLSEADVMGKGVGAALVAASVRAVLRGASQFNDVGVAVNRSARAPGSDLAETATFVTVFTARLEPPTGDLTYVDAGHGLSAIVRRSGSVQHLASLGPPVGVLPDSTGQEQGANLGPGDTFITLSDGWLDYFDSVSDAAAAAVRIMLGSSSAPSIVDHIGGFSRCVTPDDDLTVIAVRGLPVTYRRAEVAWPPRPSPEGPPTSLSKGLTTTWTSN